MSRYSRKRTLFRHIVMLLAIPLALTSSGYALFSQQLSIDSNATKPAYSSSNNVILTYTKVLGSQGGRTTYDFTVTVKNIGTVATQSWQAGFDIPSDFVQFSCDGTVSCSTNADRVSVSSGAGNGAISPGGSIDFNFSFASYSPDWTLQNVTIAGTLPLVYQTIPGLTVSATPGTRTKNKNWFYWPYSFVVTNNSGSTISAWRIQANWSTSTNQVSSMDASVNYVEDPTQLTILSTSGMADSTTFPFSGVLGSTDGTWVLSGVTIQGVY